MNSHTVVNNKTNILAAMLIGSAGLLSMPLAHAGEIQYGSGDFTIKGGLLGLESEIDSSATVYTIKEQHANLPYSDAFYNYSLSTYKSNSFANETNSLNTIGGGALELPDTNYDWQGIDAQVTLGYDIFKRSPNDYFGVGISLGIALPYIDNTGSASDSSSGSSSDSDSSSGSSTSIAAGASVAADFFSSKTEFSGRKLGPKIMFGKSLNRLASVYGEVSYARQNMRIKNSTLDFSSDVGGDYFSYELGMRYQPFSVKKEFGFITLEPSLYFTFGVNYSELNLDEFKIDLTGQNFDLESFKLETSSTTLNFGVGYSF